MLPNGHGPGLRHWAPETAWASLLTLLVAGPWVRGGYLFGTDWPGPRRFGLPAGLSSSAPVQVLLATMSWVVGGEATGKLFAFGLVFLAAWLAFRAVPTQDVFARAAGSALYVFNPFVFDRFHYGQLFLLAGYALLPWIAVRLRVLYRDPGPKTGLLAALSLWLVASFTIHLALVAAVLGAALLVAHLVAARGRAAYARRLVPGLLTAVIASLLASAYWIVPTVTGRGPEGAVISATGPAELAAYAAVPDPHLGLVPNLLGLYGFWAENSGRFTSLKQFVPFWPLILILILAVCALGAATTLRRRADPLAPWVAGLLAAAAMALLLEMGISHPLTSGFVRWLDATVPVYRGMRDAGKWAAMLALVYSQLGGLGVAAIMGWTRSGKKREVDSQWAGAVAAGLLLALPVYYGNGLLFGLHGEITPSAYPSGWYAADRVMAADPNPGTALFLPWHEYLGLSFVENQNRVIASPAPTFFSVPVLVSANPELPGVAPPSDPAQAAITGLLGSGEQGDWAQVLADLGVKYVVLAREADWASYQFLDRQPDLVLVGDYGSIVLYRNSLWH